jgi:hypothetical protein
MTPQPTKKMGNGQLNLNTVLLTICVGLSGWALKSIEDLKSQVAGQIPIITANSAGILDVNKVNREQSDKLEAAENRITTLEILQKDQNKNRKN